MSPILWNEGIIPLLITNHSGILGAESKLDFNLKQFLKQSNQPIRNKLLYAIFVFIYIIYLVYIDYLIYIDNIR